jgi:hypothetical protein
MQTKDRNAQSERDALTYLAHDARRIIASYQDQPHLRETLIRALCSRLSDGVIAKANRSG